MIHRLPNVLCAATVLLCSFVGRAGADSDAGVVIFTHAGRFWQTSLAVDGAPSEPKNLAAVPEGVVPTALRASSNGRLVLLEGGNRALRWKDGGWSALPCVTPALPSPGGQAVLCHDDKGPAVVSLEREARVGLPGELEPRAFLGPGVASVVGVRGGEIIALAVRQPSWFRVLGNASALRDVMPAPDGHRAVAVSGEGVESRVVTFSLGPSGAPRRLGGPAVPVAWADDSSWVALQFGRLSDVAELEDEHPDADDPAPADEGGGGEGDAGATAQGWAGCAVRATGGEMKCWLGYRIVGFSPDVSRVLLFRDGKLHTAALAGIRPAKPREVGAADGVAVWLRQPID